ncbi:MAG: lysozyme [Alphaproteobacteria bacterium]|nr:lysozyme [Alphaproteobacteria bacterium]
MKISNRGLIEIAEHEGIVPGPYLDSRGIWTWGIGHTAAAGDPDPEVMARGMPDNVDDAIIGALKQFDRDLNTYERRVNQAIKGHLKQHQFDALVSFDFNTGGIFKARLTQRFNAGDPGAADSFMGWLKPPEIRGRRVDEMHLFQTGDYGANGDAINVWRVDNKGRLRGLDRVMHGDDLLAMMRTRA